MVVVVVEVVVVGGVVDLVVVVVVVVVIVVVEMCDRICHTGLAPKEGPIKVKVLRHLEISV